MTREEYESSVMDITRNLTTGQITIQQGNDLFMVAATDYAASERTSAGLKLYEEKAKAAKFTGPKETAIVLHVDHTFGVIESMTTVTFSSAKQFQHIKLQTLSDDGSAQLISLTKSDMQRLIASYEEWVATDTSTGA